MSKDCQALLLTTGTLMNENTPPSRAAQGGPCHCRSCAKSIPSPTWQTPQVFYTLVGPKKIGERGKIGEMGTLVVAMGLLLGVSGVSVGAFSPPLLGVSVGAFSPALSPGPLRSLVPSRVCSLTPSLLWQRAKVNTFCTKTCHRTNDAKRALLSTRYAILDMF